VTTDDLLTKTRSYFPDDAKSIGDHLEKELGLWSLGDGKIIYLLREDLDLDSDGSGLAGDPTSQPETSLRDAHGKSLNANTVPFFVLPGKWNHGIKLGDYGIIYTKTKLSGFICGDIGPRRKISEGSVEMHRRLGHETVFKGRLRDESLGQIVRVLLFPGSGSGVYISNLDIHDKVMKLYEAM